MSKLRDLTAILSVSVLWMLTTQSSAFAAKIVIPKPPPMPEPKPEIKPEIKPQPEAQPITEMKGQMEFVITPFSNMEHGWHIFEPGYRAVCADGSGVVASSNLNIDAAINGETTDGRGAYQALIIRPELGYLRSGATSGNCELTICKDANVQQPSSRASCQDVRSVTGGDGERALSFKGQVQYQVRGQDITLKTGAPGLSAWHPAFGFAAPGKAFKDYQSPIVLDMSGDGQLGLTDVWDDKGDAKHLVRFDMALDGRAYPTGWVSSGDAFLAVDRNRNGEIDNASELFGEYFKAEVLGPKTYKNGFEALSAFDSNKDGLIDARDQGFGELRLWFDRNQNGRSEIDEIVGLTTAGVKTLNLEFSDLKNPTGDYPLLAGNEVRLLGSFVKTDGKTYQMADVWFKLRRNADRATSLVHWMMETPKK